MEFPQVAYELTDRIIALYASEEIRQTTMAMQVDEFREWLAKHMTDVLSGHPQLAPRSPFDKPVSVERVEFLTEPTLPEPGAFLTEPPPGRDNKNLIAEMLKNTPPEVRRLYEQMLDRGLDEMEACEAALQLLAQQRSEAA
jgi:hypothetical protein